MGTHTFDNRVYENMTLEEAEALEKLVIKPKIKTIEERLTALEKEVFPQ